MKLSSSNIKKCLILSQKKAFLIFRETEPLNNSLYFRKHSELKKQQKKCTLKIFLNFWKWNFQALKNLGETGCLSNH